MSDERPAPTCDPAALSALDVEYAGFNAAKTVSDPRATRFTKRNVGPLIVTSDPARADAYYHRVLGLFGGTLPFLDEALATLGDAVPVRVDVATPVDDDTAAALTNRGFAPAGRIAWLVAETGSHEAPGNVVRVSPEERDRVLPLLELDGPVNPEIWALRKRFLGTDTFRIFAIEEDGRLVSLASTFVGTNGAILGNAVTHPDFRRRGHHTALLRFRLADARVLGLDRVVTDVEPDGASMRNCERLGFRPLLDQTVWQRAAKAAG